MLLLGGLVLVACAPTERPSQDSPAQLALTAAAHLEIVETVWTAPQAADGANRHRYDFVDREGRRTRLDPVATAGVIWRNEPVLLDHRQRLFVAGAAQRELARAVAAPPAVDESGRLLAYVVLRQGLGELVVQDGLEERTIARGLGGAGALTFSPDGSAVLFIGAPNGGVAGLHVADLEGESSRCLSNCELRSGRSWGDDYVLPPAGPDALHFEGDEVRWHGGGRQTLRRSWR